jgi:HD-GYP domain-containing protein (c-di-GMP phosphodiesterase class II)
MTDPALRSSVGSPPDERTIETVLGPALVTRLHGLLRSARIYHISNQAVQTQIQQLLETLGALMEDEVALLAVGEHFYVSGLRVKPLPVHQVHFSAFSAELEVRGLGGLRFLEGVERSEIEAFLRMFLEASDSVLGQKLPETAAAANVLHVVPVRASEIGELVEREGIEHDASPRGEQARARRTFWRAVAGTRAVLEGAARTHKPGLRQARRVIQPVVDTIMKEEYSILGLTALKNHDEYTYAHCVNVSMLSVAIGHRIGLPRATLANLGVAALLHDLGKLVVPPEILQKPGSLTPDEWAAIQRHPLEGVKLMTRLPGLTGSLVDAMYINLQHHLTLDGKGYPKIDRPWRLWTLSEIVTVADCYDAMTGHRAYRARPLTGFEALQILLGRDSSRFDPAVLWALVRSVGVYPAGTVLVTASGHRVMSVSPNLDDPWRPYCQILEGPNGRPPAQGDASTWDPMPPEEKVKRVVPFEEAGVDIEARLTGASTGPA